MAALEIAASTATEVYHPSKQLVVLPLKSLEYLTLYNLVKVHMVSRARFFLWHFQTCKEVYRMLNDKTLLFVL